MSHVPEGIATRDGRTVSSVDEVTRVRILFDALLERREAAADGDTELAEDMMAIIQEWRRATH